MLLYLARHGETEWNRFGKTQGIQDTCLSDLGRVQAKRLGEYLKKRDKITAIYCSDLSRARETAEIIGKELQLNPINEPLLREVSFGVWEGLSTPDIEVKYPGQLTRWRNDLSYAPKGGENLLAVHSRVTSFLDKLKDTYPVHDDNVLVISHSATIKVLILSLIGIPLNLITHFKIDQTGLNLISMDGEKNTILHLNNIYHLESQA
jgi:broad specificity phosphatase PhoE